MIYVIKIYYLQKITDVRLNIYRQTGKYAR